MSILLVCDWLHSIGQNHFYVMLLIYQGCCLYSESTFQLCASRRFCVDFKTVKFKSLAFVRTTWYSVRTLISQATSIRMMRTFRPDSHLYLEALNCSRLHLFRQLSNTSGCLSVFDKQKDFLSKHRYGKTAATVWTM